MLKYYRTIVLFYGFLFNLPITSPRLEIQVMHFWTKYCISDVVYSLLLSGSVWDQFASLMMIWTLIIWCQFLKIDLFKRGSGKERRKRERKRISSIHECITQIPTAASAGPVQTQEPWSSSGSSRWGLLSHYMLPVLVN